MAKKKAESIQKHLAAILDMPVDLFANRSMTHYGHYVLEDRAIPSREDGLKPVQRRVLWSMYQLGLKDTGSFIKSARVTGDCMGKYHPHGSVGLYQALVRLVSGIPNPICAGTGNFGGHNFEAAAERYSEVRFSKLGYDTFFNPFYVRAIQTIGNYDGSFVEPVVLPAIYPMILAIGQQGIAMATTTNVPAFTIESIQKVVKYLLKNGAKNKAMKPTAKFLAKHLQFASTYGGKVTSSFEEITEFMSSGEGKIEWVCDYTYKDNTVIVTGFPPDWSFENRTARIAELDFVAEAMDQTDKNGVKFVIRLKRASEEQHEKNFEKLQTILKATSHYRCNVNRREIDNTTKIPEVATEFETMSIVDLLFYWFGWRLSYLEKTALNKEDEVLCDKLSRQKLLLKAIDNLEIIFKLLRTKGIDKVKELSKKLKITEEESKDIWAIAVGRLDSLSRVDTLKHIKDLETQRKLIKKDLSQLHISAYNRSGG